MTETAFDQFWQLLGGALTLKFEAFELINTLPHGSTEVLLVVLVAGLSRAVAQSIILFINRVKPAHFILCLLIAAVLFTFSYFFWVFSTWLVSRSLFATNASLDTVARVLGLSYAPILFSFLVALPYFGVPIFLLLSLWSLLVVIVGFSAVTSLGVWQALCGAGMGCVSGIRANHWQAVGDNWSMACQHGGRCTASYSLLRYGYQPGSGVPITLTIRSPQFSTARDSSGNFPVARR